MLGVLGNPAIAQYVGTWHHHGPDDSFFAESAETLTLFQENRNYAKINFDHDANLPTAEVNFQADGYGNMLFSILIMSDGTAQTRVIHGNSFAASGAEDDSGFAKYIFALTDDDLQHLKNAKMWRVQVAGKIVEYPLLGMNAALSSAIPAWHAAGIEKGAD